MRSSSCRSCSPAACSIAPRCPCRRRRPDRRCFAALPVSPLPDSGLPMNAFDKNTSVVIDDAQLLADEAKYSSFRSTVHYVDPPKIFRSCEGSYMFDSAGVPFLDLQMWYSAVNFGYGNKRLNNVLKQQIDLLPQVASQYLHQSRIELAKAVALDAKDR